MVIGGLLVQRAERLERWIAAAMTLAGSGTGLAGPSRDMLIKRAAPPGATGRVYGTVYSGLRAAAGALIQ